MSFEKLLRSLFLPKLSSKFPGTKIHVKSFISLFHFSYQQEIINDVISKADFNLLKDISRNPDLVVTKPDKDQGVELINKLDYANKVKYILEDKSKFVEMNDNLKLY